MARKKIKISKKNNLWKQIVFVLVAIVIIGFILSNTFDFSGFKDWFKADPEPLTNDTLNVTPEEPQTMFEIVYPNGEIKIIDIADIDRTKNEDVVIGVMLPTSGEFSKVGIAIARGINLAIDEVNAEGGVNNKTVVAVYKDTKCDYNVAKHNFAELVGLRNVPAIIGPVCAQSLFILDDLTNLTQTLVISPAVSNPRTRFMNKYLFTTYPFDSYGAGIMARYMDSLGLHKPAVFYVGDANYGNYLYDRFESVYEKQLAGRGNDIVIAEAFDPGEQFFKDAIFRSLKRDPDSVFIAQHGEGPKLVKQLAQLGVRKNIFGTDSFNTPEVIREMGVGIESVTFSRMAYDLSDVKAAMFRKKVRAYYNVTDVPHELYTANAYDTTMILLEAIETGGYDANGIHDYLLGMGQRSGVTGGLWFDNVTREPYRDYQVIRYDNGRPEVLAEY
ncbi:ABC transporter substrate-binding protein [Candidatus Woesearchaeota archaeon]|mgnify:CR=1 FL=1|jgi:branched-chain amino acid transport system substrate-binding protein|nr:ABC transporter substrate-binding protein [Candidatus Woesearchaeota archaeon]MBT7929167.1 ABC transporter substrate-binding protein [Candidatus Peregrinibacteria bacterium]MBT3537106.1 ABC transporter substrate-binding protein [Candidatus Woesearchaeota archaeon]MBT4697215.1 ABC transporter substrate-binding protein [Candidatus Woesearchaeota archaeon]MBT4716455.1 ABC transporter substrate-binding protein [Candidatus Woesearchaeota archaeon]